jgi:hypothetical protein
MTALVNKIYMSGDWPKDFLDVTMIALPKKNHVKKCSDQRTISVISQTGKIVACILSKNWKLKYERLSKTSVDSGKVKALEMLLD